jgi:hypothetical protein
MSLHEFTKTRSERAGRLLVDDDTLNHPLQLGNFAPVCVRSVRAAQRGRFCNSIQEMSRNVSAGCRVAERETLDSERVKLPNANQQAGIK